MRVSPIVVLLFFTIAPNDGAIDYNHLKCLVCRVMAKEMKLEIGKINPNRTIDIGNYRLDAQGNEIKKTVRMAHSAVHISEILDDICEKLNDYVRAIDKKSKRLTLINLLSPTGGMNVKMSEIDIVQDGDLNKSLEYLCRDVVGSMEDEITEFFQKDNKDNVSEICTDVCDETMVDEEEETIDEVREKTEL
ncbi:protein seele [Venturia canescens]|uniref:protein seele n=1 Tax=Venturia canescens TaxID=32260 RepID=UPI001C9BE800|nr:protein seele [Venturia canescens]XP_043268402.1 protein seele [Venturia canescens]